VKDTSCLLRNAISASTAHSPRPCLRTKRLRYHGATRSVDDALARPCQLECDYEARRGPSKHWLGRMMTNLCSCDCPPAGKPKPCDHHFPAPDRYFPADCTFCNSILMHKQHRVRTVSNVMQAAEFTRLLVFPVMQ
jgi:hypothetical protein